MTAMATREPETRPYYTPKEVAALIGCDQSTIHRWFDRGRIRGFQAGPHCEVRIPASEVRRICERVGVSLDDAA